jgi:phosphoribosyl 1,2-cyclic phosphodiesterase
MMHLTVLGTGSSGNCYVLRNERGQMLLLDAGIHAKEIKRNIAYDIGSVVGCLITHEHQDHCRGGKETSKLGVPCFGTPGTREILPWMERTEGPMKQRALGDYLVMDFPVMHDAADPCGWLITHRLTGERMIYATDTCGLKYVFPHINYWLVECNYMEDLIALQPEMRQSRLRASHMSLERLGAILRANDLSDCQTIILCHMSRENGDARLMEQRIGYWTRKETYMAKAGDEYTLSLEPF